MSKFLKLAIGLFLVCNAGQALAVDVSMAKYGDTGSKALDSFMFTKDDLKVKSRKQATLLVKQRYDARVISIKSASSNGSKGYRAKLLSKDGTVFYVFVDAKTGRVSRS